MLAMDCWLRWLHYKYKQWGQWMQKDMTPNEITTIPTTNFNKVVHAFWWLSIGHDKKVKNGLYSTTIHHDMIKIVAQITLYTMFTQGLHIGLEPSIVELIARLAQQSNNLVKFANVVHRLVVGTNMHSKGVGLEGNIITTTTKHKYLMANSWQPGLTKIL